MLDTFHKLYYIKFPSQVEYQATYLLHKGMQMVRRATHACTTSDHVKLERNGPCRIQKKGPAAQGSSIGEGQVYTQRPKVDGAFCKPEAVVLLQAIANHWAGLQTLIRSEASVYSWITPRVQISASGSVSMLGFDSTAFGWSVTISDAFSNISFAGSSFALSRSLIRRRINVIGRSDSSQAPMTYP